MADTTKNGTHKTRAEHGTSVMPPPSKTQPRVLVLDVSSPWTLSATGQLNRNFFEGWRETEYLQFCIHHGAVRRVFRQLQKDIIVSQWEVDSLVAEFDPEIILYRPVPEHAQFHELSMRLIRQSDAPLVTWIMDDWPEDIRQKKPDDYKRMHSDLKYLLTRSSSCLSICDEMSEAYLDRYGREFQAFANGVDPAQWQINKPKTLETKEDGEQKPFVVRYCGGLADNMTLESVHLLSRAVEQLNAEFEIKLEIYTRSHWANLYQTMFAKFKSTSILPPKPGQGEYRDLLQNADALSIAYNFDQESIRYTQYSLANKLPECLASGAPLIAIGPPQLATMKTIDRLNCAQTIFEPSIKTLKDKIRELRNDKHLYQKLSASSQEAAFENFNFHKTQERFKQMLARSIADAESAEQKTLSGRLSHAYRRLRRRARMRGGLAAKAFYLAHRGIEIFGPRNVGIGLTAILVNFALVFAWGLNWAPGAETEFWTVLAICNVGLIILFLGLYLNGLHRIRSLYTHSSIASQIDKLRVTHHERLDIINIDMNHFENNSGSPMSPPVQDILKELNKQKRAIAKIKARLNG